VSHTSEASEPAFRLFLDPPEVSVAGVALRLLISDEAHQPRIRELAREVLENLRPAPEQGHPLTVPLSAQQMKITHTAVKLLLGDLQREQADEREILRAILGKLPDEHTIRAIELD
jgi:hypothetical protein